MARTGARRGETGLDLRDVGGEHEVNIYVNPQDGMWGWGESGGRESGQEGDGAGAGVGGVGGAEAGEGGGGGRDAYEHQRVPMDGRGVAGEQPLADAREIGGEFLAAVMLENHGDKVFRGAAKDLVEFGVAQVLVGAGFLGLEAVVGVEKEDFAGSRAEVRQVGGAGAGGEEGLGFVDGDGVAGAGQAGQVGDEAGIALGAQALAEIEDFGAGGKAFGIGAAVGTVVVGGPEPGDAQPVIAKGVHEGMEIVPLEAVLGIAEILPFHGVSGSEISERGGRGKDFRGMWFI